MAYCVILGENFEDVEALAFIDVLRRANVTLSLYGVGGKMIKSRSRVMYQTEKIFQSETDIDVNAYEGILLPGGPGVGALVSNQALVNIIKQFHDAKKILFAICAGPRLLDAAGVLTGRRYTCFPGTPIQTGTHVDEPVVVDGSVITSQGVGTALIAALKLVEIIVSKEAAYSLAEDILVRL